MQAASQKALVVVAIVFAIIYTAAFVGLLGFFPPPSAYLDAQQVLALYATHNMEFRIGAVIMMLTGAFYLPWAVVVSLQIARLETGFPLWSVLQGLSSAVGAWIFAFPPFLWAVAAFAVDRDPQLTLFMHQFAWLAFVTPASFFTFQVIPVIVAAFSLNTGESHAAFPRWMGYLTIFVLVTGDAPVLAQIFTHGPFAWNGLIAFYLAIVCFGAWFAALSVTMWRAINAQR